MSKFPILKGIVIPTNTKDYVKCVKCKNEAIDGFKLCEFHRNDNIERSIKYREENKDKLIQFRKDRYANNIEFYKSKNKENGIIYKDSISKNKKKYYQENLDKMHIKNKNYSDKNRNTLNEYAKKYRKENIEKLKESVLKYNTKNRIVINLRVSEYRKNNTDKMYKLNSKHRALKRNAFVSDVDRLLIYERDNHICQLCGCLVDLAIKHPNTLSLSIDHIIPLSKGGTHEPSNVQCTHLGCNISKGNRTGKRENYAPNGVVNE